MGAEAISSRDVQSSRSDWVDVARGIAIVLVVYGHSLRGLYPIASSRPEWATLQDRLIYAFHMPLFFILAGMWVWQSIFFGKAKFLAKKLRTLILPYLIWSIIEGVIELGFSKYVNTPITVRDLALIAIRPIEQFWFLYALFWGEIILCMFYPARTWLLVSAGIALVAILYLPFINVIINETESAILYLVIGHFSLPLLKFLNKRSTWEICIFAALSFSTFWVTILYDRGDNMPLAAILSAMTGSFGVIALAIVAARYGIVEIITYIGRGSMAIYVMHTIASAALRVILRAFVDNPLAILLSITAFGVIAPLFAWRLLAIYKTETWLGLPRYYWRKPWKPPPLTEKRAV